VLWRLIRCWNPAVPRGKRLLATPISLTFPLFADGEHILPTVVLALCKTGTGTHMAGELSLPTLEPPSRLTGLIAVEPFKYPIPFICLLGVCAILPDNPTPTPSDPSKSPILPLSDLPNCGEPGPIGTLICLSNKWGGVVLAEVRRSAPAPLRRRFPPPTPPLPLWMDILSISSHERISS